jgi:ribosomal protein S4
MTTHKLRPRLKKYLKLGILSKKKIYKSKKPTLFFLPDSNYLNTKFSSRLEQYFNKSIMNRRKLKLFFGFYKTSLLKKINNKKAFKKTKSRFFFLKELEFCSLLERRLDILLYRLGLVSTLFEAKQLISHKKIKINNCFISSYSYLLRKGDHISFDSSIETLIKKVLITQFQIRNLYNLNSIEINFKILKIVFIKEKIFLPEQTQHYTSFLKWKI